MTPGTPRAAETPDVGRPAGGGRRALTLLVVLAALVAAVVWLPVDAWLRAAVDWIEGLGWWGPVALVGLYVLACVCLVPGSVITLGAGAAFGVVEGSITVSVGATLGAAAAFLVGRYLARGLVERKVAGSERFAAVDRAVGREGFKIVLLTRLSPVFPFNVLNYAYGLTSVRFRDYVLASWLGMIPGTIVYVWLGAAAKAAIAPEEKTTGQVVLQWAGLAATLVVTWFVTRLARRSLREEVDA